MRIRVDPDQLRQAAGLIRHSSNDLRRIGLRSKAIVNDLQMEIRIRANVDGRVAVVHHQAELLANQAEALARFLEERAAAFKQADEQVLSSVALQSVISDLLKVLGGDFNGNVLSRSIFDAGASLGSVLGSVPATGIAYLGLFHGRTTGRDYKVVKPRTRSEKTVYDLRNEINDASYGAATPELIGAILNDEMERRNLIDRGQDLEAWFIRLYEGRLESTERWLLEKAVGEPIEEMSLGIAQMTPNAVHDLVDKGYITKPNNWDSDWLDVSLTMLTDDKTAPRLVSAYLNYVSDTWAQAGYPVDEEMLATLYSHSNALSPHADPGMNSRGQEIVNNQDRVGGILRAR